MESTQVEYRPGNESDEPRMAGSLAEVQVDGKILGLG